MAAAVVGEVGSFVLDIQLPRPDALTCAQPEVTEAAVCNIAFVRDGAVVTPPLSAGILGGVTRALLLEKIAASAAVAVHEAAVRPEDFAAMQECFLLSTTKDIAPVASIDGVRFRVGADTVTARLKTTFAGHARDYAAAHSGEKV